MLLVISNEAISFETLRGVEDALERRADNIIQMKPESDHVILFLFLLNRKEKVVSR